jgi:hypothetical protein
MLRTIASFEFRHRLRRISTYVYFLVFLLLGILFAAASGGAIPNATIEFGTGGKVFVNSPYALNNIISYVPLRSLTTSPAAIWERLRSNSSSSPASASAPGSEYTFPGSIPPAWERTSWQHIFNHISC